MAMDIGTNLDVMDSPMLSNMDEEVPEALPRRRPPFLNRSLCVAAAFLCAVMLAALLSLDLPSRLVRGKLAAFASDNQDTETKLAMEVGKLKEHLEDHELLLREMKKRYEVIETKSEQQAKLLRDMKAPQSKAPAAGDRSLLECRILRPGTLVRDDTFLRSGQRFQFLSAWGEVALTCSIKFATYGKTETTTFTIDTYYNDRYGDRRTLTVSIEGVWLQLNGTRFKGSTSSSSSYQGESRRRYSGQTSGQTYAFPKFIWPTTDDHPLIINIKRPYYDEQTAIAIDQSNRPMPAI